MLWKTQKWSFQLDGEGWRSSVPKYAPKNAATLMTPGLLTPEPVANNPETSGYSIEKVTNYHLWEYFLINYLLQPSDPECISPAQFDWNKSGLTDPLSAENGNIDFRFINIYQEFY